MMLRHVALAFLLISTAAEPQTDHEAWIADAYHRSIAAERTQDYDEAIKALAPVLGGYPETYTINLRLGWLNYHAGHHANAIEHYRKAVQAVPSALEPRQGLLLPLLAQQRYEEAEQVAVQILRTDIYNYYGNLRLLLALKGQEKYDVALTVSIRMLELYPADTTFLLQIAIIREHLGDSEKALLAYQAVYTLDPNNPQARAYLGLDGSN